MQGANFEIVSIEREAVTIRVLGPHDVFASVTTAAEQVVAALVDSHVLAPGQRLFYYDSECELAEILLSGQRFAGFAASGANFLRAPQAMPEQRRPSMPKRIQRQRSAGWAMPAGAVYVGRPTPYGNPYRAGDRDAITGKPLSALQAVARFKLLWQQTAFQSHYGRLLAALRRGFEGCYELPEPATQPERAIIIPGA